MYSHGTSIHLYKYLIYESGNLDASTTISPMETIGNSRNFGIVNTNKALCLHGQILSPIKQNEIFFCEYFLIFPYFLYFFRLISRLQNYYISSDFPNPAYTFLHVPPIFCIKPTFLHKKRRSPALNPSPIANSQSPIA